eukprot:Hpha_TRINITY_DN17015_c6_g2::TRINITY_DN17015_c6_g2_i11::g.165758::m.165758
MTYPNQVPPAPVQPVVLHGGALALVHDLPPGASFSPHAVVAFRSTGNVFSPLSFITPLPYLDLVPGPDWQLTASNGIRYVGTKTLPCQLTCEMVLARQTPQECDVAVRIIKNSQLLNTKLPYHCSLNRSPNGGQGTNSVYFSEITTIEPNATFDLQIEYYDGNASETINIYSIQLSLWSLQAANVVQTSTTMLMDTSASNGSLG